ncbi:MAG TPA: hypothetical protein VMU32_05060 [Solirubrobacteraceae bacterium]|nr:hypothetical protein [Solirubrobacteraceae bacterium]
MTDPYTQLGQQLARAALRQEARGGAAKARGGAARARAGIAQTRDTASSSGSPRRGWRPSRLGVLAIAATLALACSAVALAATGLLSGSPVKPEVTPNANAGNGLPVAGVHAGRIALLAPDPAGGLSWGLRVLPTTRGQTCVQVGRVQDGQLGELGVDSAFGDDGRFHPLSPDVLPPGYGGSSGQTECADRGQTVIFEDSHADRSGVRLLPGELEKLQRLEQKARTSTNPAGEPLRTLDRQLQRLRPRTHSSAVPPGEIPPSEYLPPARDLRSLAYGLLGPHAVSVTYRTPEGLRTVPVDARDGAFLIVQAAGDFGDPSAIGGSQGGQAGPHGVEVILDEAPEKTGGRLPIVSAVTFRFGGRLCSQGVGAPVHEACPRRRPTPRAVAVSWLRPTRSLGEPVGLKLVPQSRPTCAAAYLLYPCYKGQVSFLAPYAISSAGTDYDIEAIAKCKVGGRPETAWGLERDVRAREHIATVSLGRFVYTPACAATESFRVTYLNPRGPSPSAPHRSVIVGSVSMSHAILPGDRRGGG